MQGLTDYRVQYTQVNQIYLTDFTPSRVTRPSNNPHLQEHNTLDELYDTVRVRATTQRWSAAQQSYFLAHAREDARKLRGRYIEVDFSQSFPGSTGDEDRGRPTDDTLSTNVVAVCRREKSVSDPTANGTVRPLCTRSRMERKRIAFRRRGESVASSSGISSAESGSSADVIAEMDVEPNVVAYRHSISGSNGNSLLASNSGTSQQLDLQHFPHAPTATPVTLEQAGHERIALLASPDPAPPLDHDGPCDGLAKSSSPPPVGDTQTSFRDQPATNQRWGWEAEEEENEEMDGKGDNGSSFVDEDMLLDLPKTRPVQIPSLSQHSPLQRQSAHSLPTSSFSPSSLPSSLTPTSHSSHPPSSGTHPHASRAESTPGSSSHSKPRPPLFRANSQDDLFVTSSSRGYQSNNALSNSFTPSSPLVSGGRSRSVSFLDSRAGQELGCFPAEYLGSREVDCYVESVDSVAVSAINSKPVEVTAYVTSEKLRLAPPNNSPVLFKSFAMKAIFSVQKCNKNKRILGVVVWRSRGTPVCHILRCPTHLVSSALQDTILDQTQNVDDISLSKICPLRPLSRNSDTDMSSSGSVVEDPAPHDPPVSPSEFLHKFPAIHIGSVKVGRQHTVNDMIQRVLHTSRPSQALEVCLWLSLAQLRLVDVSDENEIIYESHETSRIRAIGVGSTDKRFIGYIIKEEGKPLMGHVLRCNSAGLMVSLSSFLRQACQIMFSQQGGSLYDELSTDDSEDYEGSEDVPAPHSSFFQRLRSITVAHKPVSPAAPCASFVSHSPSHSSQPSTEKKLVSGRSISSPLDFSEEDFARFSVTYVGSTTLELPFTPQSILEALKVFREGGVTGGKAAVEKNVIQMHISSLGINLIDKKHRLFVNRNYPRKQLIGFFRHPDKEDIFSFASQRQGYPNSIRCHVFRRVRESVQHILDTLEYWLQGNSS